MLLMGYTRKISKPACNSYFQSLHCVVSLDENIGEVLPYLSAMLGGSYIKNPPSVSLRVHGRLIGVHPDRIAINALRDEEEADKIIRWIKDQINDAWLNRGTIVPDMGKNVKKKPVLLEILRILPRTNCRECGHPTCLVFATHVMEGGKGPEHCPPLSEAGRRRLRDYLDQFSFAR